MDIKKNFHNKLQTIREVVEQLSEAKDEREYGYEGDMAITQLKTICRNSENLLKMMKPDTDLPEWVQSKITKSEDYISTAHDYLASEMNEEVEQLDELKGHRGPEGQRRLRKLGIRAAERMRSKNPETANRNKKVMDLAYKNKKDKARDW